jgi:phage terminase large subunit-like protein
MYNRAKADHAVQFIQNLKHTKGRWAGVSFDLLPWQDKIISEVFGTVKKDGYRQYKTAYIEIPKKNGKSELAAAVALYLLAGDGEPGAEVYGCASDRQQASIVFDVAVQMVEQSPALKKRIKPVLSQKRLVYMPTNSFYQVLSSEVYSKHGLNVHGVVFDEIHAQPNRGLWDVMTKGSGDARTQPLYFVITTAGDDPDRTSIGWEVHKKAVDILAGTREDKTFYPVIYGVDEADDWEDEKNWKKANPSLGHTIILENVRSFYADAKENPADEKSFRQLRLNQWVKFKTTKWVPLSKWIACNFSIWQPDDLKGRECYGGLDLSKKLDITAFVLLFPPIEADPLWRVLWNFWIPEDSMKERVKRDRVPYDRWVREGWIKTTPGNVIDYAFIEADIVKQRDKYKIKEIGFDPWDAMQTSLKLNDAGLTMAEIRQGFKSMSPAMKELEKLIEGRQIDHGGNPVANWMFGNMDVKQDENDNVRPIKGKKTERIDGIVALINALARAVLYINKPPVYEKRGMRSLL